MGLAVNDNVEKMNEARSPVGTESQARRGGAFNRQLWLGVGFSVAFLVLALRDVDLSSAAGALAQVSAWPLLLAIVSSVSTNVAKAARWRVLLAVRKAPPLTRSFSVLSIGLLLNAVLPARPGEVVRAYLMGEAETESKVFALGTIAVEKVTDIVFLVLIVALLLAQMALPDWLTGPAMAAAFLMAGIVPLLLLLAWQNGPALRLLERVARVVFPTWQEWLVRQVGLGLESLAVLRRARLLAGMLTWSLVVWFLAALTNYLVFWAMGLSLSGWAALLLLVVLQAGVAVPSSPGRVGVFHYLAVLSLSLFAVGKETALGYGVVLHLVVYVPLVLFGVWYLWREKITWQKLAEAASSLNRLRSMGR